MLWQDSLIILDLIVATHSDSKLLKFNIADSTLTTAILELVGWCEAELLSDHIMTIQILRIASQKSIFLFIHCFLKR